MGVDNFFMFAGMIFVCYIETMKRLAIFVEKITEKEVGLNQCVLVFLSVLAIRNFIEQFIALTSPVTPEESAIELSHNLFFFSLAYLLIWMFISLVLKIKPQKLAYLITWSFLLMLLPPIIDMTRTGGEIYWSFYLLGGPKDLAGYFVSIFGNLPSGIVYFGTKITFLLAIGLISAFVFLKTKNWTKTVLSGIGTYLILFFMGAFPSILFFIYSLFSGKLAISSIQGFHIAQFFGASGKLWGINFESLKYAFAWKLGIIYFPFLILLLTALFFLISREKLLATLRNYRYPQVVYHSGLFLAGLGLGILAYPGNFELTLFSVAAVLTLLISVWLAWFASVVVNDIYDFEIDAISNPERPLQKGVFEPKEYTELGITCFLLSLLGGLTLGFPFAVLLLVYQILAWFYSAPPFRLKKFPLLATFTSALALLMIFFLGYILAADGQDIHSLSWRITLLLLIAYTISLPIKDFKDIKGDKADGIWTIPVIFGEKKGRLIVAINIFTSYVLSVFFLNEMKLFFWAVIFGGLTFWVVVSPKTKPRQLFWPVLFLVFVYGLILVKIVFL
ncbi:MAG: hypothetical protein A2259_02430 [Candidatus Moranbacteria bacterium RIFOXYA2_FULL_43_15]|nr:MAG: hypothetical protein A2259_02430 [Candidatus Moranbacteria bacterium RIFOXYA2_FULL_43_15]